MTQANRAKINAAAIHRKMSGRHSRQVTDQQPVHVSPHSHAAGRHSKWEELTHRFFLEDCCALPDQMPFVLTFPWRRFILAMRDRHCADQNEIASFVFGVTAKDLSHGVLPDEEDRRFAFWAVGRVP
jgi:hypothetical protein